MMPNCIKSILALTFLAFTGGFCQSAPAITAMFPTGVKIGTKADINLTGKFDIWPIAFWCTNPNIKVTALNTKGLISVDVPPLVQPEQIWIRGYDSKGFSEAKPLFVGNLNEVLESESNDKSKTAQKLESPSIISGRLSKSGDIDCFSYALRKGETLVASLCANQIFNSPMDAVLQVVSPEGFVLGQDHDENRLDPELVFKAPEDGNYIIRLFAFPSEPNSTIRFAGDIGYIYRLTITNGPFALVPFPLTFPASKSGLVPIRGWNLTKNCNTAKLEASSNATDTLFHPTWANTVSAIRCEGDSLVLDPKSKVPLPFPSTISLDSPSTKTPHSLLIKLGKGKGIDIKAKSRSLGLLMNPVIRIRNSNGSVIHVFEPQDLHQDTVGTLSSLNDEIYTMVISDLFDHSSPRHICLLEITEIKPYFEIILTVDSILIAGKKQTELIVNLTKKNGFKEPIEITAEGLPKGFLFTQESNPKTDSQTISLKFSATPGATPGAFQLSAGIKGSTIPKRRIFAKSVNGPDRANFWIQSVPEVEITNPPNKK